MGPGLGLRVPQEARQEVEGSPAADPFAEGFRRAGQPHGILVAVLPPRQVGKAEDHRDDAHGAVDRTEQPQRLDDGGPGVRRAAPSSSPARRNRSRLSSNRRTAASKSPPAPATNPWLYSASAVRAGSPSSRSMARASS